MKVICLFHDLSSLFSDLSSIGKNTPSIYLFQNSGQLPFVPTCRDFLCPVSGMVTQAESFFLAFFVAASPLVTSAFGQRSKASRSAACEKNPLVTRVWFNTTRCLVLYSGHENVSKSNGHLRSHGCSMRM